MSQATIRSVPPRRADFAVVAIIPEGYEAVVRAFGLDGFEEREGYQWTYGYVGVRCGGSVSVVCGAPLDRENVAAAVFVGALLRAWRPRNLLLVDIGGGVRGRDDIRLGDVVTHSCTTTISERLDAMMKMNLVTCLCQRRPHVFVNSHAVRRTDAMRRGSVIFRWSARVQVCQLCEAQARSQPETGPGHRFRGRSWD